MLYLSTFPSQDAEKNSRFTFLVRLVDPEVTNAIKLDDVIPSKAHNIAICPDLVPKFSIWRKERSEIIIFLKFFLGDQVVEVDQINRDHIACLFHQPGYLLLRLLKVALEVKA